jgi:hypothetical protein
MNLLSWCEPCASASSAIGLTSLSAFTVTTIWVWLFANSLAAAAAGARQIECTVNGIGERAGNASLEEVVMAMKVRADRLPFENRIDTQQIYSTSQLLSRTIGFGPAEQGYRRSQRICARSGDSPARRDQQSALLRNHDS